MGMRVSRRASPTPAWLPWAAVALSCAGTLLLLPCLGPSDRAQHGMTVRRAHLRDDHALHAQRHVSRRCRSPTERGDELRRRRVTELGVGLLNGYELCLHFVEGS